MNEPTEPAVLGPVESSVRPLTQKLRDAASQAGHYGAWCGGVLLEQAADEIDRLRAALEIAVRKSEIERCASWVDARRDAFCADHGSIDPDTGALEFGRGRYAQDKEEYVGELEDIANGLRALRPNV